MNKLTDLMRGSRARATETARETADAARTRIETTYGNARAASTEMVAKSREQASAAAEKASAFAERGRDAAEKAGGVAADFTRKNPLSVLFGAVAAGALLGAILPKRNGGDDV